MGALAALGLPLGRGASAGVEFDALQHQALPWCCFFTWEHLTRTACTVFFSVALVALRACPAYSHPTPSACRRLGPRLPRRPAPSAPRQRLLLGGGAGLAVPAQHLVRSVCLPAAARRDAVSGAAAGDCADARVVPAGRAVVHGAICQVGGWVGRGSTSPGGLQTCAGRSLYTSLCRPINCIERGLG